MENNQT